MCVCVLSACVSCFRLGAEELPPDWLAQCQNEKSRPASSVFRLRASCRLPPRLLLLLTPRSLLCRPPAHVSRATAGMFACLLESLRAGDFLLRDVFTFVHLVSPVAHDTGTRDLYISRLSHCAVTSQASV